MGLKNYQKKALQKGRRGGLLPPSFDALTSGEDEHILILLKAITGSGKTVIASEYIERILTADPADRGAAPVCVIWLSKGNGMLHLQSSDKIKGYIKSASVHVTGLEKSSDFSAPRFYDNDVYVINWEKLYSDNNLVTETEDENLLSALKNTPSDMRFIMIVDEFHAGYEQETYNRIAELIKPVIILGMTATPKVEQLAKADEKIVIPVKEIQDEAMVKLGIKFNAQTDIPPIKGYETQEEYFLKLALKRRDMLEEAYRKEGVDIVPLLLIQFDDERGGKEVFAAISSIITILDDVYSHNANGDYAVWMDIKKNASIKRSDDDIIKNLDTNKVKVLLFKQAIATGWDCPRAQVILRYRKINDSGDGAFDLQTLGRIFRMPQPLRGSYYDNPSLNYGYVYSVDNTYKLEKTFGDSLAEGGDEDSFVNTIDYFRKEEFKAAAKELEELLQNENNTVESRRRFPVRRSGTVNSHPSLAPPPFGRLRSPHLSGVHRQHRGRNETGKGRNLQGSKNRQNQGAGGGKAVCRRNPILLQLYGKGPYHHRHKAGIERLLYPRPAQPADSFKPRRGGAAYESLRRL